MRFLILILSGFLLVGCASQKGGGDAHENAFSVTATQFVELFDEACLQTQNEDSSIENYATLAGWELEENSVEGYQFDRRWKKHFEDIGTFKLMTKTLANDSNTFLACSMSVYGDAHMTDREGVQDEIQLVLDEVSGRSYTGEVVWIERFEVESDHTSSERFARARISLEDGNDQFIGYAISEGWYWPMYVLSEFPSAWIDNGD